MTGQPNYQRLDFPATRRNADAIEAVLTRVLPASGMVLEIGSGSGQHITRFAAAMPHLDWRASDPDPRHRQSIQAWIDHTRIDLPPPLDLDSRALPWPVVGVDAVISINMIHVAPWEACLSLLSGAAGALPEGGVLYLYGPFMIGGRHTSDSNIRFDQSLRAEAPAWGVRNLDDVALEARARGLHLTETVKMPANNLSVIFKKRSGMA
ncbi:MAG: DUF938 domain-containing protein [Rhodospirillaceae bacterium]